MADLTELQAAQTVKIAGAAAGTGIEDNFLDVDASGRVTVNQGAVGAANWLMNLAAFGGSSVALGQTTMANSIPVTLASNQSALAVSQSGTWNITNISGTVSLPTGAATSALQTSGNSSLSSIDTKTLAAGQAVMAASSPVVIASNQSAIPVTGTFWQTTQPVSIAATVAVSGPLTDTQLRATAVPVSGTVTANIGTTNGLALDATLTGGTQKTKLVDTGGTNVASISASGALKTDGSAVTQPVSGTVTANIGTTNGLALDATLTGGTQQSRITDGTNVASVKAASTAAVAADKALVVAISPNNSVAVTGTFFQATQPVSIAATVAVSGPLTDTQLRATAVPVSGTITANIGTTNGLALDATLTGGTQQTKLTDGTNIASIKAASTAAVAADKALVVAISPNNTVAATQSGTWNITNISGSISLPTGAATEATLGGVLTTAAFQARINTLGQKTMANSTPVVLASDQSAIPVSGTFFQATQPVSIAATVAVSGPLTDTQLRATAVPVSGTVAATQSGTWNVTNISGTVSLPTGASTSALQTSGNSSLSSIDTKTPSLGQALMAASVPVVFASNQSALAVTGTFFQATQPVSIAATVAVSGPLTDTQLRATAVPVSGTVAATQSGTWNITNISGTISLPTGAATSALQTTGNSSLSSIDTKTLAAGQAVMASSSPVVIASNQSAIPVTGTFFQATQPVSAASLPLPTGAATETTLGGVLTTTAFQARINTLGQKTMANSTPVVLASDQAAIPVTGTFSNASVSTTGAAPPASATFVGGSVTTAAPTYTTGQLSALSLTTAGALRVDGSGVTQPVSGTFFQATQPVSIAATVAVSGPLTDTQLRATAVPVSAAQSGTWNITNISGTISLPTGAATSALQTTGNSSLSSIDTKTLAAGQATMAASSPVVIASNQSAIPVTGTFFQATQPVSIAASVAVTGPLTDTQLRATAVPVSGTVAATQSGTWNITNISGTVSLPTGAATSANQTTLGSQTTKINDGTNTAAVKAASTAAVATDPALVVSVSPNTPVNVQGRAASGAAVTGNPVLVGGTDGTNARTLSVDANGAITLRSAGTDGSPVGTGTTLQVGGKDSSGNLQTFATDANGQLQVVVSNLPAVNSGALSDHRFGFTSTTGPIRVTTYVEPTAAAQRSIKSSSALDAAAGTGARTVVLTYYDNSLNGPNTETITLNGTTAVNTVATNIRFIEKMEVTTAGSTLSNQGTISLYTTTAGGGTVVGSIGFANRYAAQGDNSTLWAHHYIRPSRTFYLAGISTSMTGVTAGQTYGSFTNPLIANATEIIKTPFLGSRQAFGQYAFKTPIPIVGPGRFTLYNSNTGGNEVDASFEYTEQ